MLAFRSSAINDATIQFCFSGNLDWERPKLSCPCGAVPVVEIMRFVAAVVTGWSRCWRPPPVSTKHGPRDEELVTDAVSGSAKAPPSPVAADCRRISL